ncbi:C1q-like domain-containing protein [Chitinophagaceae bacterium MMS25-I14]
MKKMLLLCSCLCALNLSHAQQKIKDGSVTGTSSLPATGSILELESNQAGLRMPRIALTNTTTWAPLTGSGTASTSPGMSVYNTNAAITSTNANYPANGVGEYNWDGTGWINKNSSITQNSLVLFSVKITATQTMPLSTWTLIDFGAKDYDKNNNYNLTTNKFTVPANAAGYYQVSVVWATTTQAANQGSYVGLFVNNAFKRYASIGNADAGSGITGAGTIVVQLAAGDIVDLRYNGNTASQDLAYMQADILQLSR